jgi:hypothetical protein
VGCPLPPRDSRNGLQHGLDFPDLGLQHFQVIAEQLDRHVGADSGDHLVDPLLDRLRDVQVLPREVA